MKMKLEEMAKKTYRKKVHENKRKNKTRFMNQIQYTKNIIKIRMKNLIGDTFDEKQLTGNIKKGNNDVLIAHALYENLYFRMETCESCNEPNKFTSRYVQYIHYCSVCKTEMNSSPIYNLLELGKILTKQNKSCWACKKRIKEAKKIDESNTETRALESS